LSRDAALRIGAIGLVLVVAALLLPGLLSPPDPPPLPADVGIGATGASGPAGALAEAAPRIRRKGSDREVTEPGRLVHQPERKPPERAQSDPHHRAHRHERPERERPTAPPPAAPPPASAPPPSPAPAPTPAAAPPVYVAPAPAPPPGPAVAPQAPGEFGP